VVVASSGVTWGLVIIWLVSGIAGSLIAQSKNRPPWQGAVLGFVLSILGVFIIALLPKLPEAGAASSDSAKSSAVSPQTLTVRPLSVAEGELERPPAAVERLRKAQIEYDRGRFSQATTELTDEFYEAARRGDRDSVEAVVALAENIATTSNSGNESSEALRLAQSGRAQLAKWDEVVRAAQPDNETAVMTAPGASSEAESVAVAAPSAEAPLSIISSRYARGEITRDEYLQLKADLEG
jgi:Short C-terminal domain